MQNKRSAIPANVITKLDRMNLLDRFLFNETVEDIEVYNAMVEILVAPFDIFGYGLYRYTFEEYCQEVPGLKLEDGARRIFINTKGNNPEDFSEEFLDFMAYINASTDDVAAKSKSPRIQKIHNRVRNVKRSEKVGVKLMQAWEERYYDKLEAREEGLAEGREEGIFKVVENMLKNNLPMQTIIDCSGVSKEEILKLAHALNIKVNETT